jgi:hypothetical protein
MAMPASGSIAIIDNTLQTCSSVCAGVNYASGSLETLSIIAGKTAPHAMTEFYSFCRETSYKQIGFSNISATGTVNTAARCSLDCICSNSAMVAGQCYTITLCHCIASNSCVGGLACVQVCGVTVPYCCAVTAGGAAVTLSCAFLVKDTNAVCIISRAAHPGAAGGGVSCAMSCITTIVGTLGLFCKTTGCSCCCVYSCA